MDGLFDRKILIIDADRGVTGPLCLYLRQLGCFAHAVGSLKEAKERLLAGGYDCAVSELILPDGRATELFSIGGLPPVAICSSLTDDGDVLDALESGAADYIFKPCSPAVLAARLKHRLPPRGRILTRHGLSLDTGLRSVSYCGRPVKLTSSEFNILCFLMSHPGEFFSADVIYERVWNASSMQTSVVRFHIANLKKALLSATGKTLILSEFGTGYAFAQE